jgi:cytochrome c oxidase assembly protein subunit 11
MLAAKNLRNSLRTFLLHLDRPGSNSFVSAASSTPFETSTPLSTFTSLRGFASAPRPPPARPRAGAAAAAAAAASRRASDQGLYLVAVVVGMVGLTYASVPLYRMFCQATGFGGTVQEGRSVEEKLRQRETLRNEALEAAAAARELTVTFNADVSDGLPWKFMPTQRSVRIRPGQSTLAFYTAHNRSDRAVTGVSTYNVAPQQAGQYFNKVQCFCFEEQRLRAGEKVDMPVFFYIDPEFATDPKMRGINHLTLSYTFFKVSEDEGDEESDMVEGVSAQGALAEAEKRPDFASAG